MSRIIDISGTAVMLDNDVADEIERLRADLAFAKRCSRGYVFLSEKGDMETWVCPDCHKELRDETVVLPKADYERLREQLRLANIDVCNLQGELDAYRSVVTVEYDEECKEWVAEVVGLHGCTGAGDTADEAVAVALGAAPGWIETMFSRLRARIAELEAELQAEYDLCMQCFKDKGILSDHISELNDRIAELEAERGIRSMHGHTWIPNEQIDAAWEFNEDSSPEIKAHGRAMLYSYFKVDACKKCSGRGYDKLATGAPDCPACHRNGKSHGWVWKETTDV